MKSKSRAQTGFEYLLISTGIIILALASAFMIKGFDLYEKEGVPKGQAISFSGPINMNGSGIYNVSEIIGNMVNITELIIHNTSSDKALYVRHDMTNAVIESTGSTPLMIISFLYMLLETASGNIILKPAGSVGIGTESPSTKLDVNGTTTTTALNTNSVNDNVYYCSTLSEINTALSSIGSGGGTIIIESGTIPVTSPININGGGSYIIQGQGADTILTQAADLNVFNISSAAHFLIEDLKIDASGVTTLDISSISINESSGNVVIIRNVIIDGTNNTFVRGCLASSGNVQILNSKFNGLKSGIYATGPNPLIDDNVITNLASANATAGASAESLIAIRLGPDSDGFRVANNYISTVIGGNGGDGSGGAGGSGGTARGIYVYDTGFGVISGNIVDKLTGGNGGTGNGGEGGISGYAQGILISSNGISTDNVVKGNKVTNLTSGNGGAGSSGYDGGRSPAAFGIRTDQKYTTIIGNTVAAITGGNGGDGGGVDDDGGNAGVGVGIWLTSSSYSVVEGNTINDINGGTGGDGGATSGTGGNGASGMGIYTTTAVYYATITGNTITSCVGGNGGGGNTPGTDLHHQGISALYLYYSTISGNTCIENDGNNSGFSAGILLNGCHNNTVTGNVFSLSNNIGSGTGYGIRITPTSDNNMIYGNTALGNDVNLLDAGTNTFGDATTNNVS